MRILCNSIILQVNLKDRNYLAKEVKCGRFDLISKDGRDNSSELGDVVGVEVDRHKQKKLTITTPSENQNLEIAAQTSIQF